MNSAATSNLSTHATQRLQQRGFHVLDLDTVRTYGEPVEGGFLMSNRAADQRIRELRIQIQQLDRLRGTRLVECSQCVITVYRADRQRAKRLLSSTIN